eukprot:TRINITY_DN116470_c0_g1_i1.p1 TRINITY_DN116470_c0_g1~~TRINITY_DN116470_c0_g1_i1.p1  ORF type:complete len:134 (+),score=25.98 TRINITY_DN116470_c0_g1_i1:101-502(+)
MPWKPFQSDFSPSEEELRHWAYVDQQTADDAEIEQDLDIFVAGDFPDLVLELAADDTCTQQQFFLHCAYFVVGDHAKRKFKDRSGCKEFLKKAKQYKHPKLDMLVGRAEQLMANPATFEYNKWCLGGLANNPL